MASKSINLKETFNKLEGKIKAIYEEASKKLKTYASQTLEKITCYETSLRKKLDELVWMDYFLRYQIDFLDPQKVINNFFLHQTLQAEVCNRYIYFYKNFIFFLI